MPKKFRTQLGEEFYVTKGLGCLCVFSQDWGKNLENELSNLGSPLEMLLNPNIAKLRRHFFSDMVATRSDGQNRVPLTPEHRAYAGIGEELVICGCGDYIELWSPESLEKYRSENTGVDDLVTAGAALLASASQVGSEAGDAGLPRSGPA